MVIGDEYVETAGVIAYHVVEEKEDVLQSPHVSYLQKIAHILCKLLRRGSQSQVVKIADNVACIVLFIAVHVILLQILDQTRFR